MLTWGHEPTSVSQMRSWPLCIISCVWLQGGGGQLPKNTSCLTTSVSKQMCIIARTIFALWLRRRPYRQLCVHDVKKQCEYLNSLHFHPRPLHPPLPPLLRAHWHSWWASTGSNTSPLFMERVHLRARLTDQKMLMIGGGSGGWGDKWSHLWRWLYFCKFGDRHLFSFFFYSISNGSLLRAICRYYAYSAHKLVLLKWIEGVTILLKLNKCLFKVIHIK